MLKLIGIGLLTIGLLTACSSNSDELDDQSDSDTEETETITNNDEGNESDEGGADTEASEQAMQFDDQVDLLIGDTAQVSSTLGAFEMTVNSINKVEEMDGQRSPLDYYLVVNVTLKNIGDTNYDAKEMVGAYRITNIIDGSGQSDISSNFETIEEITGNLESGEVVSGDIVFDVQGEGEQYLKINGGLISSDSVHNDTVWTFTEEEME